MNPKSLIPLKPDAFHILLMLMDGPRHGYALMKDLAQNTGGQIVLLPGALYRRLQNLLEDGLIAEVDAPSDESRRRTFTITDFGRSVAEAEANRLAAMVEAARLHHLVKNEAEAKT